jgi:hypothetical protein
MRGLLQEDRILRVKIEDVYRDFLITIPITVQALTQIRYIPSRLTRF